MSAGRRASVDRFDDRDRKRMVATYLDTGLVRAIVDRWGVSDGYARSVLRDAGLNLPRGRR